MQPNIPYPSSASAAELAGTGPGPEAVRSTFAAVGEAVRRTEVGRSRRLGVRN